jgi:hypothetical protein
MAFYFRPFPTIKYRIPNQKKSVSVTDITRRFALTSFISNAKVTFDQYLLQDGDRPDTVAYEYYRDQTLDWLVLLANEIHDPYFQWPRTYEQFNSYIKQKYGSLEYAQSTNHHYEQIITPYQVLNDSGTQRIIQEKTLTVDYTTYASLIASERRAVSIYDYENKINEDNRNIYLLDLNYTLLVKEQHPYIFDEGVYVR